MLKNVPVLGTIFDHRFDIADATFPIFSSTFDLGGVGSQHVGFVI